MLGCATSNTVHTGGGHREGLGDRFIAKEPKETLLRGAHTCPDMLSHHLSSLGLLSHFCTQVTNRTVLLSWQGFKPSGVPYGLPCQWDS